MHYYSVGEKNSSKHAYTCKMHNNILDTSIIYIMQFITELHFAWDFFK